MLPSFVNDQLSLDLTTHSGTAESGERREANAAAARPVGLEQLLTAREVGQRLGLSTATVLDWFEADAFRASGSVGESGDPSGSTRSTSCGFLRAGALARHPPDSRPPESSRSWL